MSRFPQTFVNRSVRLLRRSGTSLGMVASVVISAMESAPTEAASLQQPPAREYVGGTDPGDRGPGDPTGLCHIIPNGSFSSSLLGWTVTPVTGFTPAATASAAAAVVNGTSLLIPMDSSVARLAAAATADGSAAEPGAATSASAEITLSTTAVVTGRYLKFTLGGGWEVIFFASGNYGVDVRATVLGPRDQVVAASLDQFTSIIDYECGMGLAVLGVYGLDRPQIVLDLQQGEGAAPPIEPGDMVEIRVTLKCTAGADDPCDFAQSFASVYVDDFRFCGPELPTADLDGDGVVGGIDLALLLAAWGPCPSQCPADLTFDGAVSGLDIAALLASWGG